MSYLIPFACLAALFFMFSLLLGEVILSKFSRFSQEKISNFPHFSSFIGIMLTIRVFSLFYSGGKSINVFGALLLLVFFLQNYKLNNLWRYNILSILKKKGLFFFGDYKIITMVDDAVLYADLVGATSYNKVKESNRKLPNEWYDLDNLDKVAVKEDALLIAIPKDDQEVRSKIHLPIKGSLNISKYKLLFIQQNINIV